MSYDLPEGTKSKLCARIDISKAKQVGKIAVGKKVNILVKGKVKSIRGPDDGYPGSLELELDGFSVEGGSEFSEMAED